MLAWSPLLIQKIEIQALGFRLRKLQLNRHRAAEIAPHAHPFAQLILYLSGEGRQTVGNRRRPARQGDVFVIPAGTPHGFAQQGRSLPLCLVLDYDLDATTRKRSGHRELATPALAELHALLARVPTKGRLRLVDYAPILSVVALLLEPQPDREPQRQTPPLLETIQTLFRSAGSAGHVARRAGYHPDHLNRKLKRESGIGLRELRDRMRLEKAQNALRSQASVAIAAESAGFDDPSYFTRWFRRRTGKTPTAWRG